MINNRRDLNEEQQMKSMWLMCCLMIFCAPRSMNPFLSGRILFLGDSITEDGRYVSIVEYELFRRFPTKNIDVISIGLSSETVSGLTEPGHPYPRPNVHERLRRALVKVQPTVVYACYGMNDGIYHPPGSERLSAFQNGVQELIAAVHSTKAQLVLLTPPFFDVQPIADKAVCLDASQFGYASPYEGYNDVLAQYGEWLTTIQSEGVHVIDLNRTMQSFTKKRRKDDAAFTLSPDGVHPQMTGHALMARQILEFLDVPLSSEDVDVYARQLEQDSLFQMVHSRRQMRSSAWLVDIGFIKPGDYPALPLEEAERRCQIEKEKILKSIKL